MPPATDEGGALTPSPPGGGFGGPIESRLTNVVVAALKEAFDRDHARLELERAQLDQQRAQAEEQRRRADEAMRLELRRQATERETSRLRLVAGAALVGWVASVAVFVASLPQGSPASRVILAAGWMLLLGSLAAAFTAQGRLSVLGDSGSIPAPDPAAKASVWLLTGGLALSAVSLLV